MSKANHRRMTSLGWISSDTPTCFPESFDLITPEAGITWETYREYCNTMNRWENCPSSDLNTNRHNATIKQLYEMIAQDLGGYSLSDMFFACVRSSRRLENILDDLIQNDMRPTIDVMSRSGDVHTIGVKPYEDGRYKLIGKNQPNYLKARPVTAAAIMHHLVDCGDTTGFTRSVPFQATNISALPKPPAGFVSLSI